MEALQGVVAGYVSSMRSRGEAFSLDIVSWLQAEAPPDGAEALVAAVHKFAGSAGSAGFMRLSAVATLIEIALRGGAPLTADDRALVGLLAEDFAAEIAALSPDRSSLLTGEQTGIYVPFAQPYQVLLAGLSEAASRILSHVVEQRLGMVWTLPEAAMLSTVPAGRAPDLVVVPVVVFAPRRFDDLTADWPIS